MCDEFQYKNVSCNELQEKIEKYGSFYFDSCKYKCAKQNRPITPNQIIPTPSNYIQYIMARVLLEKYYIKHCIESFYFSNALYKNFYVENDQLFG